MAKTRTVSLSVPIELADRVERFANQMDAERLQNPSEADKSKRYSLSFYYVGLIEQALASIESEKVQS